jgi:hypothetical protein
MALCLIAAGKTTVLAGSLFTLSWTHSVERTRWEEDWRITPAGLEILEARIRGSGAGMEPPESSVLRDGWWVYRPALPAQRQVTLAQSAATGEGWTLCAQGSCVAFGSRAADPAVIRPCGAQDQ